MVGADFARPLSEEIFILRMCFIMMSLVTCFVRISDGFSDPGTFVSLKSPRRTRSWTHISAVAKCLIFPRPLLQHMPMAAVASVKTSRSRDTPISQAKDCSSRPIDASRQIPPSSASPELRATVVCVTDQCLIQWLPLIATPPDVDRRVI